jgi:SET domain
LSRVLSKLILSGSSWTFPRCHTQSSPLIGLYSSTQVGATTGESLPFPPCCRSTLTHNPNHSCSPNARWEWNTSSFSLHLSAVRPIRRGEEITIQYICPAQPWEERQASLRSQYNFTCDCWACSRHSLESDRARAKLAKFWSAIPTFEKWCLDASMPDDMLINAHMHALEMIEKEGLQVLDCCQHVDGIAMCYGALEEVALFRLWMEKVRDYRVPANPKQAIVFSAWLSNPTCFPAWGRRRTSCGTNRRSY